MRGGRRVHVHTASGVLHAPPGLTFVSYDELLRLAWQLTRDHASVVELFRRAAFNVASHNRDDHSRNFSFEMDGKGRWSLAPAYDLTFAEGPGEEHTMTVAGEGRSPGQEHLRKMGRAAGLKASVVNGVLDEVLEATSRWSAHADAAGLSKRDRGAIGRRPGIPR